MSLNPSHVCLELLQGCKMGRDLLVDVVHHLFTKRVVSRTASATTLLILVSVASMSATFTWICWARPWTSEVVCWSSCWTFCSISTTRSDIA